MNRDRNERGQRLFIEQFRAVRRYISKVVAAPEIAEELTQEAFARLTAMNSASIQSPERLLFRTARNLAIDHVRRRAVVSFVPLGDDLVAGLRDETPSAEDWLLARDELERVGEAIKELPPKCRQVFLLLKVEGLSFQEVAAEMGLSQTMVRNYAARAVEHCQLRLGRSRF